MQLTKAFLLIWKSVSTKQKFKFELIKFEIQVWNPESEKPQVFPTHQNKGTAMLQILNPSLAAMQVQLCWPL